MTVLQLLICVLWCQRLLRQNEYCCYKLLLRVEKKKVNTSAPFSHKWLHQWICLLDLHSEWVVLSVEILEHYLEKVFRHRVLYFAHMSAISVHSLPCHHHCTL